MRFHRINRNRDHSRNFLIRQLIKKRKVDTDPVFFRQFPYRNTHRFLNRFLQQVAFGHIGRNRCRNTRIVPIRQARILLEPALVVHRLIVRDSEKPCRKTAAPFKTRKRMIRLQKNFLRKIPRFVPVVEKTAPHRKNFLFMPFDERPIQFTPPGQNKINYLIITERIARAAAPPLVPIHRGFRIA